MSRTLRAEGQRIENTRPDVGGTQVGRLHLDPKLIPIGMEGCWVREKVLGQRDDNNLRDAMERGGYVPATTADIPSRKAVVLPGDPEPTGAQLIRSGDNILMLRPKAYADEDRAAHAAETQDALRSVARLSNNSDARMDGKNFRDSPANVSDRISRNTAGKFPD